MAPIPAFITLNWTSNYAGQHRVCYRIQGSGDPYVCTTALTPHPACPGGGAPCAYQILITVDQETCDTITYEGYVQPICEPEESLLARTTFNVSFIPSPSCKRWRVDCDNAPVEFLTLDNGGSGYDPLAPAPTVTISGGGGAGANATTTVGQGLIQSLAIGAGGSGYTDNVYVGVLLTGGSGAGATADVTIVGGVVTIAVINNPGSGYQDSDVLALDTGTVGVPGVPVQLNPTTDYGIVTSLVLGFGGSGYTSVPTVLIDPPPGLGLNALGSATLDSCLPLIQLSECDTQGPEEHFPLEVGESVHVCYSVQPPGIENQYVVTEDGTCLCDCTEIEFTAVGGNVDMVYFNCTTQSKETFELDPDNSPLVLCIATGSLTFNETTGTLSQVVNGPCDGDGI